ncbi:unnamed protein product [Ostreobium quekettii]|uniref:Fungal lipase-type domain-containing protein n=1 Tax=Ostreobium quekettii TaxID=121088 RepID=A0A8S1J2E1_9CHLO|nr:unnamed protein product [Ostreobium quekettii]|eukprot:evm.model.scf_823.2 EVM.evm.TU.scf_823.2   scf_823:5478-6637(-)
MATEPLLTEGPDKAPTKPFDGFVARPGGKVTDRPHLINAWSLAHASMLAYRDEATVKRTCGEWGFKFVRTLGYEGRLGFDTECYVAANEEIVVVAFRGTEPTSWRDWVSDLNALKTRSGPFNSYVHQGFLNGLLKRVDGTSIRDEVVKEVSELIGDRAVYITGHSLGAALATLCTAFLLDTGKIKVEGLYTYGSPRVGTHRFANVVMKKSGGKVYRFVNKEDLVARVPKVLYHHVGNWWYMSGKNQTLTKNPGFCQLLKDRICIDFDYFPDSIADHSIKHGYVVGLWKNIASRYDVPDSTPGGTAWES